MNANEAGRQISTDRIAMQDFEFTIETTLPAGVLVYVRCNQDEGKFIVTPAGTIESEADRWDGNGPTQQWLDQAEQYLESEQIVAEAYNRVR